MENTTETENRFYVKIESKIIEDVLNVIRGLQSEIIFIFDKEGLKFNLMDSANVCLMDGFIKQSLFLNFELNFELKIGFNSDNLYKIFKENKKTFVVFEGNAALQELNLIFSNGFKTKISLLDIESENKKPDNMLFFNSVFIESKKFKEIIKKFSLISDSITFNLKDNKFFIKSSGLNSAELVLSSDEVLIKMDDYKTEITSKYSLEYLNKFIKVLFADNLTLKFNNTYPLLIEEKTDLININYLLAPRIEGED